MIHVPLKYTPVYCPQSVCHKRDSIPSKINQFCWTRLGCFLPFSEDAKTWSVWTLLPKAVSNPQITVRTIHDMLIYLFIYRFSSDQQNAVHLDMFTHFSFFHLEDSPWGAAEKAPKSLMSYFEKRWSKATRNRLSLRQPGKRQTCACRHNDVKFSAIYIWSDKLFILIDTVYPLYCISHDSRCLENNVKPSAAITHQQLNRIVI